MYFYILNSDGALLKYSKYFIFESNNLWKIFFPTGLFYKNNEIIVSYGVGDSEIKFSSIDKKTLINLFKIKNNDETLYVLKKTN